MILTNMFEIRKVIPFCHRQRRAKKCFENLNSTVKVPVLAFVIVLYVMRLAWPVHSNDSNFSASQGLGPVQLT